jgi:hypothetical protein
MCEMTLQKFFKAAHRRRPPFAWPSKIQTQNRYLNTVVNQSKTCVRHCRCGRHSELVCLLLHIPPVPATAATVAAAAAATDAAAAAAATDAAVEQLLQR